MKTTIANPFTSEQLLQIFAACTDRSARLHESARKAFFSGPVTDREQDSPAALWGEADRFYALAMKVVPSTKKRAELAFSRADLETALEGAEARHAAFSRTLGRANAVAYASLVTKLTDLVADTALVHDEY